MNLPEDRSYRRWDRSEGRNEPALCRLPCTRCTPLIVRPAPHRRLYSGETQSTMNRFIQIAIYLVGAVSFLSPDRGAFAEDYPFYHENVMGTSLELRVRAVNEDSARRAEARVLGEIDRLSAIFSGYDESSEFSRWRSAAGPAGRISSELYDVLAAADSWCSRSRGAFDPRVEALSRLWSAGARGGRLPSARERTDAKALMDRPAWRLHDAARTAERLTDCPLSLNGIAKGFIVERACELAMDRNRGSSA